MSKSIECHSTLKKRVCIPTRKITGFTEVGLSVYGNCFIATGADGVDGGENGWYVIETYDEVKELLDKQE